MAESGIILSGASESAISWPLRKDCQRPLSELSLAKPTRIAGLPLEVAESDMAFSFLDVLAIC
jgi:hypothetical protein